LVVGDFDESSDNAFHGYTYKGEVYTQYDVDLGVVSTSIFEVNSTGIIPTAPNTGTEGINDSSLLVGHYTPAGKTLPQPYKGTE
jgi:hypothetical protein